ncbi:hypothetical protein ZIOFF_074453 (mitochondrion) [Zingiber officinale]|uniref:DNA-directed RNA polymerase n=1 Tax=Zingiber officinale TaxID=94328 RepID=A0A8J5BYI4_ZINOF|nr:hypothetical protein ZIOFF_074453 [Zingiber officinale]
MMRIGQSSNMQRQAVPLSQSERCIVGTGLERQTALDSGVSAIAEHEGKIIYTDPHKKIFFLQSSDAVSILETEDEANRITRDSQANRKIVPLQNSSLEQEQEQLKNIFIPLPQVELLLSRVYPQSFLFNDKKLPFHFLIILKYEMQEIKIQNAKISRKALSHLLNPKWLRRGKVLEGTPGNRSSGDGVGPVAQRIRARGYEPRSRGFESLLAHNLPFLEGPFPLGVGKE